MTCADPGGRQPLGDRRAISADPRLDPDTTVWASTDAGFGDRAPGIGDDAKCSPARPGPRNRWSGAAPVAPSTARESGRMKNPGVRRSRSVTARA